MIPGLILMIISLKVVAVPQVPHHQVEKKKRRSESVRKSRSNTLTPRTRSTNLDLAGLNWSVWCTFHSSRASSTAASSASVSGTITGIQFIGLASSTSRSRSVTPVPGGERGANRQSAARRALLLDMALAAPARNIILPPSPPPPQLSYALSVRATPGGSHRVVAGGEVPVTNSPGGRVHIQQRQVEQELPLNSDVVERVEAMDMSEDEVEELVATKPWHVQRWLGNITYDDGAAAPAPAAAAPAPAAAAAATDDGMGWDIPGPSGSNTVCPAPLISSAVSKVTVVPEDDVRPSTSMMTVTSSSAVRCDGSDLDSDFDDEFDAPVMPSVRRNLPDTEELEEPEQALVSEIEMGMDDAADSLLGTSASFTWEKDFGSFRAVREEFSGPTPGPIKDYDSPYDVFTDIWDEEIIGLIVTETNRYAHQIIESMRSAGTLKPSSRIHSWTDTDADEIMRFFAVWMYMAIDSRTSVAEYWSSNEVLQMPGFKRLMSYNRYILLNKCLHFVDNTAVASQQPLSQTGDNYSMKISARLSKMAPVLQHLGKKFDSLYNLGPEISIDESLTLFKGRLTWIQTIRSKAARFGIKSYELCESRTGYMARFQIYTGKDDSSDGNRSLGVNLGGKSTQVVLELLQGLERRGHCVVMDNFYNCPSLARYLKSLGFDCFGTLRVNRRNVPSAIAKVPKKVRKGTITALHCGDVSIIAWMDSKMVNIISTFHRPDTYLGTKAGKPLMKPVCVKDYNRTMGGVDLKDQKLSMYLLERKRGVKWYFKMFKRLMNVSIHNAHVMYQSSLARRDKLSVTHREFRYELAESLLKRHRPCLVPISMTSASVMRLRRDIVHSPAYLSGRANRRRCMLCYREKKTKFVHLKCSQCDVFLCLGDCWTTWHSAEDLPGQEVRGWTRRRMTDEQN